MVSSSSPSPSPATTRGIWGTASVTTSTNIVSYIFTPHYPKSLFTAIADGSCSYTVCCIFAAQNTEPAITTFH